MDEALAKSTGDRAKEQAEQELWALTASDQPDAAKIEAKLAEIGKLSGDERLSFIRAVGDASKLLTDEQRKSLTGFAPPTPAMPIPGARDAGRWNERHVIHRPAMNFAHLCAVRTLSVIATAFTLLFVSEACAQSPEEHSSHHHGAAGAMPAGGGGMMEQMGGMMKGVGKQPPKELYPALMSLPELTTEQRKLVEDQAGQRMHAGSVLIGQSLDSLNAGTQSDDYAAMHEAMTRLREGAAQMESGIAARRALAEGRAPRKVALAWFKREMNLSPGTVPAAHQRFGLTVFHLFTMILLIAFALAMVAMYFFKMRRAAALFERIELDKSAPPPGSAPELAGSAPPDEANPSGGKRA